MADVMTDDEAIQATNDDASTSKQSAVQIGYWTDNYIKFFVRNCGRKPPEINRGYYARMKGIEFFLNKFIQSCNGNAQIINLGAGFDTLYWRLKDSKIALKKFVEFDFPNVTSKKCSYIKKHKQLSEKLDFENKEVKSHSTDLHSADYHLVGVDLRYVSNISDKLTEVDVDFNLPTLIIAECVLVYMDMSSSSALLKFFAEKFCTSLFVNYEQVNIKDTFGNIMLSNLRSRGCLLSGYNYCTSLDTQKERFLLNGWDGASAWTMIDIYRSLVESDRLRIESIEMLDEQELLIQLLEHYCISIGWKGKMFENISMK